MSETCGVLAVKGENQVQSVYHTHTHARTTHTRIVPLSESASHLVCEAANHTQDLTLAYTKSSSAPTLRSRLTLVVGGVVL